VSGLLSSWSGYEPNFDSEEETEWRIEQESDLSVIIQGLEEIGYVGSWRMLDSQYFNVAQMRERVFIIGHLRNRTGLVGETSRQDIGRLAEVYPEILFESDSGAWDFEKGQRKRKSSSRKVASCLRSGGKGGKPSPRGVYDGIAHYGIRGRSDYSEGSSTLRSSGGDSGGGSEMLILSTFPMNSYQGDYIESDIARTLAQRDFKSATDLITFEKNECPDEETETLVPVALQQNTRDEVRLINGDGQTVGALAAQPGMKQQNYICGAITGKIAHTDDNTAQAGQLILDDQGGSQINVRDDGMSPTLRHEMHGHLPLILDGPVAIDVRNLCLQPNEQSGTLQAKQSGGYSLNYTNPVMVWEPRSQDGVPRIHGDISNAPCPTLNTAKGGQRQPMIGIRRLTPTETLRLQGFPDDWFDGLGLSDSAKYRMTGNAVTVNVVEWIGKRLLKYGFGEE
jgi:DNA (cytosine-5)-methyltransferase 1